MGYGIKLLLSVVFAIKKIITGKTAIIQLVKDKRTIRFSLFLTTFVGLFRAIVCLMRRKFDKKYDKFMYLLAGLVGGTFSAFFLEKSTRQALALFLLARAIDSTYRSLVKKGYLPQFKYFYVLLYSLSMMVTGYCFVA